MAGDEMLQLCGVIARANERGMAVIVRALPLSDAKGPAIAGNVAPYRR